MKPLRWLLAGLVWIVAGLLGLVGALLSVTVLLLPLGIPLLMLSRRLFRVAGQLVLPRSVRHPVQEAGKAASEKGKGLEGLVDSGAEKVSRSFRRSARSARDAAPAPVADVLPGKRRGLGRILHPGG